MNYHEMLALIAQRGETIVVQSSRRIRTTGGRYNGCVYVCEPLSRWDPTLKWETHTANEAAHV